MIGLFCFCEIYCFMQLQKQKSIQITYNDIQLKEIVETFKDNLSKSFYSLHLAVDRDWNDIEKYRQFKGEFQNYINNCELILKALKWKPQSDAFLKIQKGILYHQWMQRGYHLKYAALKIDETTQKMAGELDLYFSSYMKYALDEIIKVEKKEPADSRRLYIDKIDHFRELLTQKADIIKASSQHILNQRMYELEKKSFYVFCFVIISLFIGAGIIIGGVYFYFRKKILNPLNQLLVGIEELGKGNFNLKLSQVPHNEIGFIMDRFIKLSTELKETVVSRDLLQKVMDQKEILLSEKEGIRQQLIQSQKLDSLGQFAGGIAHDYNNLIGSILGYAELIQNKIKNDEQLTRYIKTIIQSSETAADLSQKLLKYSQKGSLDTEVIHLDLLLMELKMILDRAIINKKIQVQIDCEKDLGSIKGTSTEIFQIFMNLAMNAKDAMPDGGILSIEVKKINEIDSFKKNNPKCTSDSYVEVRVKDTGVGIPIEIQKNIFDPFFTTKPIGQGTGLGLSIVYEIVHQHQGMIEFRSQKNKGTTFILYFPVAQNEFVK